MLRAKNQEDIARIRASCQIVQAVQVELAARICPGVTTADLDRCAEELILSRGATPAFKGYRGYPATICASVNAQVVHGIPGPVPLASGDLVSIDVGVCLDGYFGDGAFTVGVGQVAPEAQRLIETTRECLDHAIDQARPGNRLSDISHAVESHAVREGMSVVRQFGGHGIGQSLHEDPHINNYGRPGRGPRLRAGYVFAIEPILSLGSPEISVRADGWTAVTQDGSPAAHFEHTVAVTDSDPDILTLSTL